MTAAAAKRDRVTAPIVGVSTLIGLALLLELLIRAGAVSAFVVPPPSAVLLALERVILDEHVLVRFADTAAKAVSSTVLIALVGIPIGLLLFRRPILRRSYENWIAGAAAAPVVLFYPLFLVLFGRGAAMVVMIAFASGLAPVVLKTVEGLRAIRPVLVRVGRSLRMTPWQEFTLVLFPAALPVVFVGLRLGIVFSLVNVVGVEFLVNAGGLGALINELSERYDLAGTYASIGFVVLVSIVVFVGVEKVERWLQPGR